MVGWLRPAILLPIAAIATLTPAQVEAILAHELAHIRRHDYAVNLLQTIAETLLFYHPAVWWLSKRVRAEREHCCDEIAVEICGDAVAYAKALAELESWRTASPAMAVAATGGSLVDRVRRILRVPITDEPRSPSWAVTLALTMIFTAGAGSIQHLPWLSSKSDARAESSSALPIAFTPPPGQAPAGLSRSAIVKRHSEEPQNQQNRRVRRSSRSPEHPKRRAAPPPEFTEVPEAGECPCRPCSTAPEEHIVAQPHRGSTRSACPPERHSPGSPAPPEPGGSRRERRQWNMRWSRA